MQEIYLKLWTRCQELGRISDSGAVFPFVKVLAVNVVRDHFRFQGASRRDGAATIAIEDLASGSPATQQIDLDREVLIGEIDRVLLAATSPTSARDRRLFWLHYRHGMSAPSIASIPAFGLTVDGVESALRRLTSLVRTELTRDPRSGGSHAGSPGTQP